MVVTIKRIAEYNGATLGVLSIDGQPRFVTLEDPWKDNQRNVSCIPAGEYQAIRHNSPKYGPTFWVQDVPNRSEILIHWGNSADDTRGCILLGTQFGQAPGKAWIAYSRNAMDLFMLAMRDVQRFTLKIEAP